MDNKIYISDGLLCKEVSVSGSTVNPPLPFNDIESFTGKLSVADIAIRCSICEEDTLISSNDYRAQGVFICDKCKAAIKHIRNILENGGSIT